MKRRGILWYVFVGSRGGETRMCIVDSIMDKPKNARELALQFDMDYSTIRHSLRVLEKNRIVWSGTKKYGKKYCITPEFEGLKEEYAKLQKLQQCGKGGK